MNITWVVIEVIPYYLILALSLIKLLKFFKNALNLNVMSSKLIPFQRHFYCDVYNTSYTQ